MRYRPILLVGQAPNRGGDGRTPLLGGRSGGRLAALAGLSEREYARAFDRANLLGFEGKDGKGDAFDLDRARIAARALLRSRANSVLIFLGRVVARAFGVPASTPYLTWRFLDGRAVAILPHPSGINRWWNDPSNVEAARAFLRRAVEIGTAEPPGNRSWDPRQGTWVKARRLPR